MWVNKDLTGFEYVFSDKRTFKRSRQWSGSLKRSFDGKTVTLEGLLLCYRRFKVTLHAINTYGFEILSGLLLKFILR